MRECGERIWDHLVSRQLKVSFYIDAKGEIFGKYLWSMWFPYNRSVKMTFSVNCFQKRSKKHFYILFFLNNIFSFYSLRAIWSVIYSLRAVIIKCFWTMTLTFVLENQGRINLFFFHDWFCGSTSQSQLSVTNILGNIMIWMHLHYNLDLWPWNSRSYFVPHGEYIFHGSTRKVPMTNCLRNVVI